jgi:Ca2+-transporting ATPase
MPVIKKVNGSDVIIYKGSKVVKGTGKGFVIATGEQTEYGRISEQKWEQKRDYQFHLINRKHFILLVLLLPALIISLIRYHNPVMVSAIFIPLAVIVLLLQNTQLIKYVLITNEIKKLEGRNIYFRDITALEDFNKVDITCFDKTGVLTTRHIEVTKIYCEGRILNIDSVSTEHTFNLIKIACALCNDVLFLEKIDQANPVDRALISFAIKNGGNINETLFRYKSIYEKSFDSEERYMARGFELSDKKVYYFAKGDPEVILNMCKSYVTMSGIEKKIDFEFLSSIKTNVDSINEKGDIIIALAYSSNTSNNAPLNYTFLCLLQLENPLIPGVREIISKLNENGIRSVMLTGDRPNTAGKIGQEIGITNYPNADLTGRHIERMELSEVARQSANYSVFARLLPSQKGILIRLFQQKGHYVAMVGDGANDTIALKVADVGISFTKNSSPFAKRLSKILINDLSDLLMIVQGSKRLKWRVKFATLFRIVFLITLLFALYMWVLNGNLPYQLTFVVQVVS